jgi:hypothetical protein
MTPETTALVQWVKDRAQRAEDRDAYYPGWGDEEAKRFRQIEALLSQERTCSTCRHAKDAASTEPLAWPDYYVGWLLCRHPERMVDHVSPDRTGSWGCLLWEQAETKERG